MKAKQKAYKKRKKILLIASISTIVFFSAVFFVSEKTKAFTWSNGWGKGIWNSYILGHAEDDPSDPPTIGWLKSSSGVNGPCLKTADSTDYEIYFQNTDLGSDVRFVSGKAWFGIGSQPDTSGSCQLDLPSLGWLDFGFDPGVFCGGQSDCHAARWHKTGDADDNYTGYLDGYAHIESMGDNGWVRLRGDNNGEKYKATADNNAVLSGYVWNSGTETAILGNSGLGWIKTDGLIIAECDVSCVPRESCDGKKFDWPTSMDFCNGGSTLVPNLEGGDSFLTWSCSRGCGSKDCEPDIIIPEVGVCGSLNGKYVCDPANPPTADKLCSDAAAYNNDLGSSGITATWTCGNICGEKVDCSASARCGWIETAP